MFFFGIRKTDSDEYHSDEYMSECHEWFPSKYSHHPNWNNSTQNGANAKKAGSESRSQPRARFQDVAEETIWIHVDRSRHCQSMEHNYYCSSPWSAHIPLIWPQCLFEGGSGCLLVTGFSYELCHLHGCIVVAIGLINPMDGLDSLFLLRFCEIKLWSIVGYDSEESD